MSKLNSQGWPPVPREPMSALFKPLFSPTSTTGVNRLFNLTDADRLLLTDHSHHAMIDYPYGAV